MGWLEEVHGKVVCLDTAPIIYYVETKYSDYKKLLDPFFDMVADGKCSAVTSVISLLEGLVLPIRNQDVWLVRKFQTFFYRTLVKTVEISSQIAADAAKIRAAHNKIRTADAIQIAAALHTKAEYFLTNDKELTVVSDIKVLILDDLKIQMKSDQPETDS